MLPKLPNKDQIKKAQTVTFSGINRQPNAPDGTVFWTKNMGSDRMPCLSPRKNRYLIGHYNNCCGMFAYNGLYLVDGTTIYHDGVAIGEALNDSDKLFAAMNDQIVVLPDKILIDAAQGDADWQTGYEYTITNVDFQTREHVSRILILSGDTFAFRAGDWVTISGCRYVGNNKTAQILSVENEIHTPLGPAPALLLNFAPGTFIDMDDQTITFQKDQPTNVQISDVDVQFLNYHRSDIGLDVSVIQSAYGGLDWRTTALKPGDEVTITGSTVPENNKSATILYVTRRELVFADGTFANTSDQNITITAQAPAPEPVTQMEVRLENISVHFEDGAEVKGNTIKLMEDDTWPNLGLRVGDAVRITGGRTYEPMIIRGIDGIYLYFDDESFEPSEHGPEIVSVTRAVPDLDGMFVHENRLWGWKGNTIYASKLGDPTNFDVFDGLESDSWNWTMDGSGDILGAIVYQGYPTFFKEDKAIRIYGDRPSQYRSMDVTAAGIHPGCGNSLAVAGDTLYYVSRNGMAAFSGGYSRNIHAPFGEMRFTKAVAGSDGRRYFLSAYDGEKWNYLVYDTVWDCWFHEDQFEIQSFSFDRGNLFWLQNKQYGKNLWLDGHAATPPSYATPEAFVYSEVVFNDFTGNYWTAGRGYGNPSRKGTSKIQLRVTLDNAALTVWIAFDGGEEQKVAELVSDGKRSYYLPIIPRRSDNYKIILRGAGDWTLNSLVREEYSGSDIH